MTQLLLGYLLGINFLTFFLYGLDKRKAVKHQWRIPEKTLLGTAFLGGSVGAIIGMRVFHHKTKHWTFRILVPIFLILHLGMIYFYCTRVL